MKFGLLLLILIFMVNGVFAQSSANPCLDSIFLVLKTKPVDQMTDGEYAYFQQKNLDCGDFQLSAKREREQIKQLDKPRLTKGNRIGWIVGVSAGLSLIPVFVILTGTGSK